MSFKTGDIAKQENEFIWKGEKNNDKDYYKLDISKYLIENTKDYYYRKAQGWSMNLNCPEYLRVADIHLKKEEERAVYYL